jgi:hypothetical protein
MIWAENEFGSISLGDKRLNKRLVSLATRLGEHPNESIVSACHGWDEAKSAYRFFENEKVSAQKILLPHINATHQRMSQEKRVLLLQDTTELDYSNHHKKTGIGYLNSMKHKGLLEHPLYAVNEARLPLGLVSMTWWTREKLGQAIPHEQRPIEEKETFRWLEHYRQGNRLAQSMPHTHFIVIGDRENDIYEVLQEASEAKQNTTPMADLLIRCTHDRRVKTADGKSGKLKEVVSQSPLLGIVEFELQSRKGENPRWVTQEIRATLLTVQASQPRGTRGIMKSFTINVVHLKEINPPEGVEPVEWFLLTTLAINTTQQIHCVINWYLARWEIELYFKTLKSGCTVEEIQLQEEQRFLACLALYHVIAWHIMFLTKVARVQPDLCCTKFLTEDEWRTAYMIVKKKKPNHPPTIGEAIRLIAQVGGYLARKSDGPPGLKNLWRGLSRLHHIANYNYIVSNMADS